MNQIILINKEKGYTSRDVVNVISKCLNTKKVGHFGTLDPLATGLLIIGVGDYTKVNNLLENDDKEYVAEVLVGVSTDTYDVEGTVLKANKSFEINEDILKKTLSKFKTTYMQEVPIYSATKLNGKKLYQYAREGVKVELPKKEVTINSIELINLYESNDKTYFSFKCNVSKGTYIRSLINDISKELDIPLCMNNLKRIKQGKFSLEDANTLDDVKSNNYKYLNIRDVLDLEEMEIPNHLEKKILNGSKIDMLCEKKILFTKDNTDVVIYAPHNNEMKPVLTFKK